MIREQIKEAVDEMLDNALEKAEEQGATEIKFTLTAEFTIIKNPASQKTTGPS